MIDGEPIHPANDDIEAPPDTIQPEVENALRCLRSYQQACDIPLLPEEEERILLEWIVKGGRLPDHLNLDENWRKGRVPRIVMSQAAQSDYNWAQIHLLLAIEAARGESPPLHEIEGIAEAFAMAALDRIRLNPEDPSFVVVEVVKDVLLLLDRDPKIRN